MKQSEHGEFDREEFDRWLNLPDMEKVREQLGRIEASLTMIAESIGDIADTEEEKRLRYSQLGTVQTVLSTAALDLRVCTSAFDRLSDGVERVEHHLRTQQGEG